MASKAILVILMSTTWSQVMAGNSAYSNNINQCLFDSWPANVLSGKVPCKGSQLCYSVNGVNPAQFAVCYNTKTLIPDFTGHVIVPPIGSGRDGNWHNEAGPFAPNPQSSVDDYKCDLQNALYPNYNKQQQQFCSRGHLSPNSDFAAPAERKLTFINTNIAPQWQPFNGGNWARVEEAVRDYGGQTKNKLYIFTGTAGFGGLLNGNTVKVKLNGRVFAPRFYWKVVCDPLAPSPAGAATGGQSVLIMADNNIGDISTVKIDSKWNPSTKQTKKFGFVQLYSLAEANKVFIMDNFHLPPLGKSCNPDKQGTFLNSFLDDKLQ